MCINHCYLVQADNRLLHLSPSQLLEHGWSELCRVFQKGWVQVPSKMTLMIPYLYIKKHSRTGLGNLLLTQARACNPAITAGWDQTRWFCYQDQKEFYSKFNQVLSSIPREDKIVLLGKFYARLGRVSELSKEIEHLESKVWGKSSQIHDLIITNSLSRQSHKWKILWMHPHSKHWHLTDYIMVCAWDHCTICITRAITSADNCWMNHCPKTT